MRLENLGMCPPPQNPVFQVGSEADFEGEFGTTAGDGFDALGFVPDALGGEAGGKGVEANDHAGRLGRLEGREARGHHVADGEILRALESELQQFRIAQAGERKSANTRADEVVADEIPLIVDTTEVVGFHAAALGFFTGELEVIELHRALLQNGLREDVEDAEFLDRVTDRAERDGGIQILKGKEALLLEVGGHFLEG